VPISGPNCFQSISCHGCPSAALQERDSNTDSHALGRGTKCGHKMAAQGSLAFLCRRGFTATEKYARPRYVRSTLVMSELR